MKLPGNSERERAHSAATLPPEEVLDSARYIHESALRLHRLIENFLVFSQMELMASESKKIEMSSSLAPVEVATVVPEIARKVAARLTELETDGRGDEPATRELRAVLESVEAGRQIFPLDLLGQRELSV